MRAALCTILPRWLSTLAGLAAIVLSFTAAELGIDRDAAWGPRRTALFALGVVVLLVAQRAALVRIVGSTWRFIARSLGLPRFSADLDRRLSFLGPLLTRLAEVSRRIGLAAPKMPQVDVDRAEDRPLEPGDQIPHLGVWKSLSVLALVLLMALLYVWVVSAGFWLRWPGGTSYYDLLAEGFLHGRTSLMIEPDPRLVDLGNPYSLTDREGIPTLWDASYFDGKYFLYWGPVPALLLTLPRLVSGMGLPDLAVVFAATCAILVFSSLILVSLWRRYFAERLPHWLLLAGVLLIGFGLPVLWVLSSPNVYEASVASGMAFFLAGVYLSLPLLLSLPPSRLRLVLAGTSWALAVGSRAVLLVPTLALIAIILVRIARGSDRSRTSILAKLVIPLAIGAAVLGWYNFDRFGNPFETGFRYQLTGRDVTWNGVFDPRYLVPNTYNYLLRSFRTLSVFPFLKPIWGVEEVPYLSANLPAGWGTPQMYTPQPVSGILVSTPAHLFAFYLAWWVLCGGAPSGDPADTSPRRIHRTRFAPALRISMGALLIAAFCAFLPAGLYHWSANRFLMDFMPLVAILSVVGAWVAVVRDRSPTANRIAIRVLVAATFLASATAAFLLAVSGDELRLEHLNPALFDWITRAFAL